MPTKKIRAAYLRKQAITLRSLANVLEAAAKLIVTTEVGTGIPRTENDETILNVAEFYNSVADNLESQGVELIGVESYSALASRPQRDSASPASLVDRKPPRKRVPRTH